MKTTKNTKKYVPNSLRNYLSASKSLACYLPNLGRLVVQLVVTIEGIPRMIWGNDQSVASTTLADFELKLEVCCPCLRALGIGLSSFHFSAVLAWLLPLPLRIASGLLLESLDAAFFLGVALRCTAGLIFSDHTALVLGLGLLS